MEPQLHDLMLDGDFWSSLLYSPTFWLPRDHGALLATLGVSLALFGAMIALPVLSARRRRLSALGRDQSGSVTMLDFVLVTPLFVFFMFAAFQFAILARNHLFTHYAAYMAARSARVYLCPPFPITVGALLDDQFGIKTCDSGAAMQKAEMAARLALIPAAPFKTLRCRNGCQPPEALLKSVAEATGVGKRWGAIQRQARYMFDRDNVKVTISTAPMANYVVLKRVPHVPVKAFVEARFLLIDYAGWLFADGKRRDGYYYTVSRAEVTLL